MSIIRSFFNGVSGLSAMGGGMGVISDNIANAGTNGFKANRAEFQSILSVPDSYGNSIGAGVELNYIKSLMDQGDIARTEVATDLAISGDGFFQVNTPFGPAYTRDGSLHFDKDGYLVSSDGHKIMGYNIDERGNTINQLKAIRLNKPNLPAKATEELKIEVNLDSRARITDFDKEKPDKTSNFNNTMTVYDSLGTPRLINIYYNKLSDNEWVYHAMVDGVEAKDGAPGTMVEMAKGKIVFTDKGILQEDVTEESNFNFNQGAVQNQKIKFDFGKSLLEEGNGENASTSYSTDSSTFRHSRDGHAPGKLVGAGFDSKGVLKVTYDNSLTRGISQISLAKFENSEGLRSIGRNLFSETNASGHATLGAPTTAGRGEIVTKSLELSNVDIASEFVKLMMTQRNFTANARAITTADEMLSEVINIKR